MIDVGLNNHTIFVNLFRYIPGQMAQAEEDWWAHAPDP